MPSISSRVTPRPSNYEPTTLQRPSASFGLPNINTDVGLSPGFNTTLRSSLPPISAATDNLRQFYTGGLTPQYRVLPLTPLSNS